MKYISTYLLMKNPTTSYIAAMFHPTIGQLAHQSLSNAATPELGMIPQGLRVNCRLTHSQGDTKQPNQIPLGLTGLQQAAKPAPSKGQPLHTNSKTTLSSPVKEEKQPGKDPKPRVRHSSNPITLLSCSWP